MKTIIFLLLITITLSLFSQKIEVKDVKHNFQSGQKFALSVNIHSDDRKDITKVFKKEAEYEKESIVEKKGEVFIDNASIPEISADKIDVFFTIEKLKNGTASLIVCFEVNNEYIIPKSKEYKKAVHFMENLSREISIEVLKKELEKEEKSFEKIKGKIASLENKNADLTTDSKKRAGNIAKGKVALKTSSEELNSITENINNGKGKFEKLAKEKEKLDNKYEKLTKNISKNEQAIKSNQKKIEGNTKEIQDLKKEKANQKSEVEKAKGKLAKVRK